MEEGEDLQGLICAARCGDLDEVKRCISAGIINREGPLGMTAVAEACRAGQKAVVKFLLECGAEIGDVLHLACEYKDVDMVKVLVTSGVSLDNVDKYGKTPLHMAVERQSIVVVEALLKHGALVDKADLQRCQTPIHIACELECVEVVRALIAFGAKLNLKDSSSNTPLHIACSKNKSLDVMSTLLKHGALIDESDRYGDTALHIVCDRGRLDMVRLLLQHGASVNIPNRRRLTPLHLAFDYGPIMSILLDYGSGSLQCSLYSCPCKTSVLRCQYEFDCRTLTTVETYEKHFIKVETAKLNYVDNFEWVPADSEGWGQPERDKYSESCLTEIQKMKTREIGNTKCSYFDLLCRKKSALQNEKIKGTLSTDILGEFPNYGDMIYCSYLKIPEFLRRQDLAKRSCRFFELTKFCQLPVELVPLILEYLSDVDLEHLVKICDTNLNGSNEAVFHNHADSHQQGGKVERLNTMLFEKCKFS